MKHAILHAFFLSSVAAFAPATTTTTSSSSSSSTALRESKADLEAIAAKANPVVKFFDPLNIADADEATIGWFRHAEIKHGRIAMFAFVGYIVQSNFVFPWPQTLAGDMHPSVDLTPEAQWDAIPYLAKAQIFALIAFLEFFDETGGGGALPHYTKGRKPGQYPSLKENFPLHFCLDLYDPAGLSKNKSAEKKERGLIAELNNGRLAQIGTQRRRRRRQRRRPTTPLSTGAFSSTRNEYLNQITSHPELPLSQLPLLLQVY